ncbi:MAG TPA: hypothetical protein VIQ02_19835, partial [Jiangellaceae bacterium]
MGFQRVIEILDQAIGGPDVGIGRHGAFWRGITRDEFVAKKVLGKPLVPGDATASKPGAVVEKPGPVRVRPPRTSAGRQPPPHAGRSSG